MTFDPSDVYLTCLDGSEAVRVGVGVALTDETSRLLLELRSDVMMWGITGGRLEPGETPEACAIREIHEETGLLLDPMQLEFFGIFAEPADGRILQYPDHRVHLLDIIYTARISSRSSFLLSPESLELSFFSALSLPQSIVPPAIRPIEQLVKSGLLL